MPVNFADSWNTEFATMGFEQVYDCWAFVTPHELRSLISEGS